MRQIYFYGVLGIIAILAGIILWQYSTLQELRAEKQSKDALKWLK